MPKKQICYDVRVSHLPPAPRAVADQVAHGLERIETTENDVMFLCDNDQKDAIKSPIAPNPRPIGSFPLYFLWEKRWTNSMGADLFVRFRSLDEPMPSHRCHSITVLFSARRKPPFILSRKERQHYAVCSQADSRFLQKKYQLGRDQIVVTPPFARRGYTTEPVSKKEDGWLLILINPREKQLSLKKFFEILDKRFPQLQKKKLKLDQAANLSQREWAKYLQNAELCFYLTTTPLDWPFLALESFLSGIPTIYADAHGTLSEQIKSPTFKLSRFLIESPSLDELKKKSLIEREAIANLPSAEGILQELTQKALPWIALAEKTENKKIRGGLRTLPA